MADFYQTLEAIQQSQKQADITMECPEQLKVQLNPEIKSFHGEGAFTRTIPMKAAITKPSYIIPFSNKRHPPYSPTMPSKRVKHEDILPRRAAINGSRKGVANLESILNILDNKNCMETIAHDVKLWIRSEYFYSYIDKPYFAENSVGVLTQQLKLEKSIEEMTSTEWKVVRASLGKVRRFSTKFIRQEKEKLHNYRIIARELLKCPVIFLFSKKACLSHLC
jgi:hypothetical protein